MGNTATAPAPSAQSPPSTRNWRTKSRKLLFSPKPAERPLSSRPLSPGKSSNTVNTDAAGDPTIPDDELEALKQACLSHIEQLVFIIKERTEEDDPEDVFALLKQCISNARKQLSKYQESTVNQHERPHTAKSDANFDWGDINLESIENIPLPDDLDPTITLSPPNSKDADSPTDSSNGAHHKQTASTNTDDSYDNNAAGNVFGSSLNSSLLTAASDTNSSNLRTKSSSHKSSHISNDSSDNNALNNFLNPELNIDYIGSLIVRDGNQSQSSKNKKRKKSNLKLHKNDKHNKNDKIDKHNIDVASSDSESELKSDSNRNNRVTKNILDEQHGIQHPFKILENICSFLTVSERFRFGVCNKELNKEFGSKNYSFNKQFQLDNIYWAQHFDQFYTENNDSIEIWNGIFHKLTTDEISQLKYFMIYYHMFNDAKKITNFKAIIPSDLETLVISGNKPKNEQQRRRFSRFVASILRYVDTNNVIDWLYLESNSFIDEDIQCISRGLLKRTTMSNLSLISLNENTNITDKCIPVLLEAIGQKGRKLQFLSLVNCKRLTNATCEAIVNFYKRYHGSTKLHEINLSRNKKISERGINLLDQLIKGKKNLPKNDNFVLFKIIVAGCGFKKRREHWPPQLEG